MNNCPRCKNEEISDKDNYCKICGLDLKETTAVTVAPKTIEISFPEGLIGQDPQKLAQELSQRTKSLSEEWKLHQ